MNLKATTSVDVSLPLEKIAPVSDFSRLFALIYGPPKIGKSTLASTFPGALFVATEEGLRFLNVYKVSCPNWLTFREVMKQLKGEEAKQRYKTIVIDTVDLLYRWCEEFVCDVKGLAHPSDEDWGKGWAFVRDEFQTGCKYLTSEGYGVVFISHHREVETKIRGVKVVKTVPSFSNTARKIILPLVDFVFYLAPDVDAQEQEGARMIYSQNAVEYEAGSRQKYFPHVIDEVHYTALADALSMARAQELAEEASD